MSLIQNVSIVALGLGSVIALGAMGSRLTTEAPALASAIAPAAADAYTVDPVHSAVVFRIKHAGIANFWGRFNDLSGTFTVDESGPVATSFAFTIKNDSVDTANQNRDNHLRNPDFFSTKQFETTTFKGTSISKREGNIYELTGNLTLHGETKPVTATLEWFGTGSAQGTPIAAFEATFDFKRSDFGMTKYLAPDLSNSGGLGNDVRIIVAVEAKKQ